MKNIKEVFSDIIGYRDFKKGPDEQQKSFLFWDLFILKCVFGIVVLTLIFKYNVVFADGTYSDYTANTCFTMVSSINSASQMHFTADTSGRLVFLTTKPSTSTSFSGTFYIVSPSSSFHSSLNTGPSCVSAVNNSSSIVIDGIRYYYRGISISSGGSYDRSITIPEIVLETYSPVDAVYYTYGEGAAAGATYDNYCQDCKSFYFNSANSRYGNIEFSSNVRMVFFNDSFYAVSLNSFTGYINTSASANPSSCGANTVNVRSTTYDGITFYFMSFNKGTFDGFGNDSYLDVSGSNSLAYRYTFGDLKVDPSYNACNFDYSPARYIYPTPLVRHTAEFTQSVKGQWYDASNAKHSVTVYLTRYNKIDDTLYSGYLVFPQNTSKNTYSLTSNGFDLTWNELVSTGYGITCGFTGDSSFFNFSNNLTTTNHLQNLNSYLDSDNWTCFNNIYLDPDEGNVLSSTFDTGHRASYGSSAFDFPSVLHFTEYVKTEDGSPVENPYYPGDSIKFYYAINDSELYYDYYILLGLNLGQSSVMSSIYNYPGYLQESNGDPRTVKDFYYAMSFLNLDNVWLRSIFTDDPSYYSVGFDTPTTDILDGKDQGALGVSENPEQDSLRGHANAGEAVSRNMNDFLYSEDSDFQSVLTLGSKNYDAINQSFNSFTNNQYLSSVEWFSNQLDYLYYSTRVRYFLDASLILALGLAVFF